MAEHHDPPVIRIVKKGHGHGHHGGAWKVAFADFVTAMMALFIVLWILGQTEDVKRGIGGYFRDPTGKALLGPGPNEGPSAPKSNSFAPISLPSTPSRQIMPDPALESQADKLLDFIEENEILKGMQEQISVEVTHEGLRVEINEGAETPLFESGSARLSAKLIDALSALAQEYAKLPNKLVLEGHTDATPYGSHSGMTNWELSTMRANEARRALETAALSADQVLMVRGYADRKPRFEDSHDPRNRRISMLLLSDFGMSIALGQAPHGETSGLPVSTASPSRPRLFAGQGDRP